MIGSFAAGALVALALSKKNKDKEISKEEIKETIGTGVDLLGKVASATIELTTERINKMVSFEEKKQSEETKKETKIIEEELIKFKG